MSLLSFFATGPDRPLLAGAAEVDRLYKRHRLRIMLAITIKLYQKMVAIFYRKFVTGLECSAIAKAKWIGDHRGTGKHCLYLCVIA